MTNSRAWIIVVLVGTAAAIIVTGSGEWLMMRPWGNVAISVISDFFFVVGLAGLLLCLHRRMLAPARRFFGIRPRTPIQVFTSTHADCTTTTQKVMTLEEYEVADELRSVLKRQFPEFVGSWARLFGVDVDVPEIVIKGSPLENIEKPPGWGSLILVGGPTRNRLTEFYLSNCHPWLTFDDENKKFVERIGEGEDASTRELDDSHKLAMVQKLTCKGTVVILAFGFGEVETAAAVRHLAYEWKALAAKYRSEPFARLLFVNDLGQVQVREEYP